MRDSSVLSLFGVLTLLLTLACGDDDVIPFDASVMDGGSDAGPDAGPLTQPDGGPVPMMDSGAPDAATDGGPPPVDGGPTPPMRDTVSVLAGQSSTGFVDGTGVAARFSGPSGGAMAPDGSAIYIADTFNAILRRIDLPSGEVTTVAGRLQVQATTDGVGLDATFQSPRAMSATPDGTALYVADGPTLRRVDLDTLAVETIAGVAGMSGNEDGIGDEARLGFLIHSSVFSADGATLYLSDRSNKTLRALDIATAEVTTLAGASYPGFDSVHVDGVGTEARFSGIGGLVRVDDALFTTDTFNASIRRIDLNTTEVTTFAGQPGVEGSTDGIGAAATFEIPQSLTTDGEYLYVVGFNGILRRVAMADASVETILGTYDDVRPIDGAGESVRLGIAFGPPLYDSVSGDIFYNDRDASSIRRIELDSSTVSTLAGANEPRGAGDGPALQARFDGPDHVVCESAASRCYVSDSQNHTIRVIDVAASEADSVVTTLAGLAGEPGEADGDLASARFAAPAGMALDETARLLYVADSANELLRVIDLDEETVSTLAGAPQATGDADGVGAVARFSDPERLALSADGATLYVSDTGNSLLRAVVVASGEVTTLAGASGIGGSEDGAGADARFRSPMGLALSESGTRLFVADRSAQQIRVVELSDGSVGTIAGTDRTSGVSDGAGADALLSGPTDLLVVGESLYIADRSNALVRHIDLADEVVTTWLGDIVRKGNIVPEHPVAFDAATLYFPQALARLGDDMILVCEDAVLVARPETW